MSQSATRPLGRQLAYRTTAQTLAGSHHIACKLHAITEDYHPPGRHQNRIFRLLQPFRAKTSIFMKKATFTLPAVVVGVLGSLLYGVPKNHGNRRKSPWEPPWGVGVDPRRSLRAPEALSRDQSRPKERSKCSKNRLWTILRRFLSDSKGSEVLRASAGPSRGALLPKSTFFASVTDFCLIWSPQTPLRVAFGLPLGALWGPLAALGMPWGSSRAPLGLRGDPVRVLLRASG